MRYQRLSIECSSTLTLYRRLLVTLVDLLVKLKQILVSLVDLLVSLKQILVSLGNLLVNGAILSRMMQQPHEIKVFTREFEANTRELR